MTVDAPLGARESMSFDEAPLLISRSFAIPAVRNCPGVRTGQQVRGSRGERAPKQTIATRKQKAQRPTPAHAHNRVAVSARCRTLIGFTSPMARICGYRIYASDKWPWRSARRQPHSPPPFATTCDLNTSFYNGSRFLCLVATQIMHID